MGTCLAKTAAALAIQLTLLAALWALVRLGPAGWLAGTACTIITCLLLTGGLHRAGARRMGPADRVTLARALLVCSVTALVVDRSPDPVLLAAVAGVALLLDGIDGQVARRTGTASALGARFDMEVDAFLILVLSVHDSVFLGLWVLAIGLMRYGFVAASVPYPWLKVPLPPSYARKTVAAVQGVALTVAVILPHPEALAAAAAALATLTWSFARDIRWLARKARADRGAASVAETQPTMAARISLDNLDDGVRPTAIANPKGNSSRIGWVISTVKVPARIMPAEVMTPPVAVKPPVRQPIASSDPHAPVTAAASPIT